ncbi:MAG: WhiB family transcriptional regulator [Actinomycetota bacterium]
MNTARTTPRSLSAAGMATQPWDEDASWQERALCRQADPNLFFAPQVTETKEEKLAREAKAKEICARCPVKASCLRYAIDTREPFGIWGGLNETERRQYLVREAG